MFTDNSEPGGTSSPAPPSGTVTFLLTDIEGSTRQWEASPTTMAGALDRHNALLTEVIERHGGVVVTSRGEGDSFFAVFTGAAAAVSAAGDCHLRLARESWPPPVFIRVRMGLHTGEATLRDGEFDDHAPINRAARIKGAAHGGQVLLSQRTRDLCDGRLPPGFSLVDLGEHRLRDLEQPEHIHQLVHPDLPAEFPPINTLDQGNVHVPLTSFVGRDGDVAATISDLQKARLVTLIGAGWARQGLPLRPPGSCARDSRTGAGSSPSRRPATATRFSASSRASSASASVPA